MVWWVDRNESIAGRVRYNEEYDIENERIIQSVNIMFNFAEEVTDVYDIYYLIRSGVNILNIDRTLIEETSYNVIKKTISDCKNLPQMCEAGFVRPVCVSVTMSILDPITIDKDVDVVILKDVTTIQSFSQFKESNLKLIKPVFLWISKCYNDDVINLIRVSNGIVLDYSVLCNKYCLELMQLCKLYQKPIFCLKQEVSDYNECFGDKRKIFVVASEIINYGFHGIVLNQTGTSILRQTAIIQSIVKALKVAEDQCNPISVYETLNKELLKPQLVPMTVAMAATSAAISCGAAAIILLTSTGVTARLISCSSPPCHVIAVTTHDGVLNLMHLYRKVLPALYKEARAASWQEECRKRVLFGTNFALKTGLFVGGAKLVVLAPTEEATGYCDGFQIVATPFRCDE